jgi:hypothetical protein
MAFFTWFLNLDIDDLEDWNLAGDFNLYRSVEEETKQEGMPMRCNYSMISFQPWTSSNCLSMVGLLLGVTCSQIPC